MNKLLLYTGAVFAVALNGSFKSIEPSYNDSALMPVVREGHVDYNKIKPFKIEGRLNAIKMAAKVHMDYMYGATSVADSALVKDGKFSFSGLVDAPSFVRMAIDVDGGGKDKAVYAGDVIYFYLNKGDQITIKGSDSLATASIKGSKLNDSYHKYNDFIGGTIMELNKTANYKVSAASEAQRKDTTFLKEVNDWYLKARQQRNAMQLKYAEQNPAAFFSMVALSEAAGSKVDVPLIQPLFLALDESLRDSDLGKELEMRINAALTITVGAQAPDFSQNDQFGNAVSLANFKGKYLLLEFWASWCGPCRAENPNLLKQYQLFHSKGFDILGVSLDDKKDKWETAIKEDALPWKHVSDLRGWNNAVGRMFGVRAVPASFLIDPDGKILAIGLRGEELNQKLSEIFN